MEIVPRVTGSPSSKPRSVKLVTALARFPYVALTLNYFPNGKTSSSVFCSLMKKERESKEEERRERERERKRTSGFSRSEEQESGSHRSSRRIRGNGA